MKFYEHFDKRYLEPIPKYTEKFNEWNKIKIVECGEPLVSLEGIENILLEPQYYLNKIKGAIPTVLVRESLKRKLINITTKLPKGYKLLVWDAYRTFETQEELFKKYYQLFATQLNLEGDELIEYTKKFVSLPSKDLSKPSPHNTGAAIDLTICDSNDCPINLGTYFDDFADKAYTRYYEELSQTKAELSDEEQEILYNRRVMYHLFAEEDFVNYPYEIWHKSYMDQMWCIIKESEIASYGSAEIKQ